MAPNIDLSPGITYNILGLYQHTKKQDTAVFGRWWRPWALI